ncbi:MAG: tRNA epoxyqueuosine(34) reductase QueG [Phycisphaeraceae bacterium]|nr:tRNA epoxyqueuosine(34) reductase QueG [Phycisphaerales bacterium]MCB9861487.1 tRNA epoxyqueuosine(34) reductase QueG [Phycisphaeraceae bacterium]
MSSSEHTTQHDREHLTQRVLEMCIDHGFALAGVSSLEPSEHINFYNNWIDSGKHGAMSYLARNVDLRLHPAYMIENARCAVVVADLYANRQEPSLPLHSGAGRVARYAQGRDYHKVIRKRLHAICDVLREAHTGHEHRAFVDTAPVLERELAQRAGLGWIGKHTLLIHPTLGSRYFLGGFFTTLDLVHTPQRKQIVDHCGSCTRCIDACPTDAITPYALDASRCISYLTIEQRNAIDGSLQAQLNGWLFGCDICMDVCPHNSPMGLGKSQIAPNDAYQSSRQSFDPFVVLAWSESDRVSALAGSSMTRASLGMLKRNAMLILATDQTTDRAKFVKTLQQLAASEDEPELTRQTAQHLLSHAG